MISPGSLEPEVGRRTLPQVLDWRAQHEPSSRFCGIPLHRDDHCKGWRDVSFEELARAVDYLAWWIEEKIGRGVAGVSTLAYLAANDIRYAAFTIAAVKAGYRTLLPSPRNSIAGHVHLLEKCSVEHFFYSDDKQNIVQEIGCSYNKLQLWQIPEYQQCIEAKHRHYRYNEKYEDVVDNGVLVIHSSGSTGLPKMVNMTHGYLSTFDNFSRYTDLQNGTKPIWTRRSPDDVAVVFSPYFHLMGFFMFTESLFHRLEFYIGPDKPASTKMIREIITELRPTMTMLPPSIIEDMSRDEAGMQTLSTLRELIYGGAPLSQGVGDRVSKVTKLFGGYGATEIGIIPVIPPAEREEWRYFEFHPSYGLVMDQIDDDIYEAVVRRPKNNNLDHHGAFHAFPNIDEYRTNDLFGKHPTKPTLWTIKGRKDDVIVLANGEKFNPIILEELVEEQPLVKRVVVIGRERFQPALLVEINWHLCDESVSWKDLVEQIWPTVEKANSVVPGHGRITKSKIGICPKHKPFALTVKGSIRRGQIEQDQSEVIESLYAEAGNQGQEGVLPWDKGICLQEIEQNLIEYLSKSLRYGELTPFTDIFALGADSLQGLEILRWVKASLMGIVPENKLSAFNLQLLYLHPTIHQLAAFIHASINDSKASGGSETESNSERVDRLVNKWATGLPTNPKPTTSETSQCYRRLILTGSTGSLGNYILNYLLQDPGVQHVYCLNRAEDAEQRTETSFAEKGLSFSPELLAKVTFWKADFGAENFGLKDEQYEELRSHVDTIIHNAWKVDFNHKLESFEKVHIAGVRRMIDLSLCGEKSPHLCFISSQSTIGLWNEKHGPLIPELPFDDISIVIPSGYGLSKRVSERILAIAAKQSGVSTSILRVGQIAGPTTEKGFWNKTEWVPIILKTSKAISLVPEDINQPVDWMPVDVLARTVLEVTLTCKQQPKRLQPNVFHLVNPTRVEWSSLLPAVHRHFAAKVVPLEAWVDFLKKIEVTETQAKDKPAIKLIDFLTGLTTAKDLNAVPVDCTQTLLASKSFRELPAVTSDLMDLFLSQLQL